MSSPDKIIKTIQPNGKIGQSMDRDIYEAIKSYMLHVLDHGNSFDINTFINLAHQKFEHIYKAGLGMLVYSVKRDLEARGLIYHEYSTRKISSTRLAQSHTNSKIVDDDIDTSKKQAVKINGAVRSKFIELFVKQPLIVHAPGRINLMGDHTDYNGGLVLPASIDKNIQVAIGPSNNSISLIYSNRFNQFLSLDCRAPIKRLKNSKWQNYVLGVLAKLQLEGVRVRPFNCVFDGDLPIGSGLASSAALASAFILGLDELSNLKLTNQQKIDIVHWSENTFAKVKCGIMDPFVSILGKEGKFIYLDCETFTHEYCDTQLNDYCFLLCDSNIKHSHPTSIYNKRHDECRLALDKISTRYPDIQSLRTVSIEMIEACKGLLKKKLSNRCQFIIEENSRVEFAKSCLLSGDYESLGKSMLESHDGLSTLFEVSCDELDYLVYLASTYEGVLGARMMGGGFGGCTLNLVRNDVVGPYMRFLQAAYKQKYNMGLQCHVVQLCGGASVIENHTKASHKL